MPTPRSRQSRVKASEAPQGWAQTSSRPSPLPPLLNSPTSAPAPRVDSAENPSPSADSSPLGQIQVPPWTSPYSIFLPKADEPRSPSLWPLPTPSPFPPHSPTPTAFSLIQQAWLKPPQYCPHAFFLNSIHSSSAPPMRPTSLHPTPPPPLFAPLLELTHATPKPPSHSFPATLPPLHLIAPTPPTPSALFPTSPTHFHPPPQATDSLHPLTLKSFFHALQLRDPSPTAHPPPPQALPRPIPAPDGQYTPALPHPPQPDFCETPPRLPPHPVSNAKPALLHPPTSPTPQNHPVPLSAPQEKARSDDHAAHADPPTDPPTPSAPTKSQPNHSEIVDPPRWFPPAS